MSVGRTPGEIFGARVREIRQKRGMTQVELGERLGFQQNRVSEIENGSRSPTLVTILRLAVALQCKPSALLVAFDEEDLPELLPK
jgi:transcriptional regulator with XRE-family HTH domain